MGKTLVRTIIGKTELNPGQSLETQVGKVELLLTPRIFFRIGHNSSVGVIWLSSTDTQLRLDKGEQTRSVALTLHPLSACAGR
jgi:hypothetical protein